MATALTPAQAGDMTHERALAASKEPYNWLLHHGNYEGWRFSQLKPINTDTVKNLKVAFTVALGGYKSGGRAKQRDLPGPTNGPGGMAVLTHRRGLDPSPDLSGATKGGDTRE